MQNTRISTRSSIALKSIFLFLLLVPCAYFSNAQFSKKDSAKVNELLGFVKHFEANGNKAEATKFRNKVAFFYWRKNFNTEAKNLYEKVLAYYKSTGDNSKIASTYSNLGLIYSGERKYDKAIQFFTDAADLNSNNKRKLISNYKDIATAYLKKKSYTQSISYTEKALNEAEKIKDGKNILECYGNLSEAHKKNGNNEKSLYYFNLFANYKGKKKEKTHTEVLPNSNHKKENNNNNTPYNTTNTNDNNSTEITPSTSSENLVKADSTASQEDTTLTENVAIVDSTAILAEQNKKKVEELKNKVKTATTNWVLYIVLGLALFIAIAVAIFLFFINKDKTEKNSYEVISHVKVDSKSKEKINK